MNPELQKTLTSGLQKLSDGLGNLKISSSQPTLTGGSTKTSLNSYLNSSFNPEKKSIMDAYAQSRNLISQSQQDYSKYLAGELNAARTDLMEQGERTLTTAREGQTGFARSPLALSMIGADVQKSIQAKEKQIAQMELAGRSEEASKLAASMVEEQTALSNARTRALNEFFQIRTDERADVQQGMDMERLGFDRATAERDALAFRTPEQKAVLEFAVAYPDAGITESDTLSTVQAKVMGSPAYRNASEYQKAQIEAQLANAAQSRASIAKIYADMANDKAALTGSTSTATQSNLDMLNLTNQILPNIGKISGASGLLSSLPGVGGFIDAGTRSQVNQLKNMLSLENRQQLKGSGAISDFEAKMLEKAASTLGTLTTDRGSISASDADAKEAVLQIRGASMNASGQAAPVKVVIPGKGTQYGNLTREQVNQAIASGATVTYTDEVTVGKNKVDAVTPYIRPNLTNYGN